MKKTKIITKKDEVKQKEKLKSRVRVQKSETEPMRSQTTNENECQNSISNIADLLAQAIETSVRKSALERKLDNEMEIEKIKANNETEIDKLKEKLNVAVTRYRTKFMEHSHAKVQWNKQKTKLINIIEELKAELVKYSPDNEIFDTVENILAITNENHVARKKSLKMEDK